MLVLGEGVRVIEKAEQPITSTIPYVESCYPELNQPQKKGSVMLVTDPGYQSFKDDVTS